MTRISINGQAVDVGNANITLTYKNNAFVTADKINSSYSNTITLPRTARNEAVFGAIVSPATHTTAPYTKHKASVEVDGVVIVSNAVVMISEVTSDAYKVVLMWDSAEAMAKIASDERTLSELSYDISDGLTWGDPIQYKIPLADYGFKLDGDFQVPDYASYHPVMHVQQVLDKIGDHYGVNIFTNNIQDKLRYLRIPIINRKDPIITTSTVGTWNNIIRFSGAFAKTKQWYATANLRVDLDARKGNASNGVAGLGIYEYISRGLFAGGEGNYIDTLYVSQQRKIFELTGDITFPIKYNSRLNATDLSKVLLVLYAGYVKEDGTHEQKNILEIEPFDVAQPNEAEGLNGYIRYKFSEEKAEVLPLLSIGTGDYCLLDAQIQFLLDTKNAPHTYGGIEQDVIIENGYLEIKHYQEYVSNGDVFFAVPNLPSVKVMDFLKGIAAITGSYISVEGDNITFCNYEDLTEAEAQDWSDSIINPMQSMSYKFGDWAKKNTFELKTKGDDKAIVSFAINNQQLKEEYKISLPFTKGQERGGLLYVQLYDYDTTENVYTFNGGGDECYMAVANSDGSRLVSSMPLTDIVDNNEALRGVLDNIKVVKAVIKANAITLKKMDMNKPVYIRQLGGYFAVVEVRTRSNGTADVELIKI